MGKPYINNAVIGNGRMLGCISETGELIRLYWPEIDYPQHIEKMLTGFFDVQTPRSTIWFSEGDHEVQQRYLGMTDILETTACFVKLPLKVIQTDFCLPGKDVLIRHYSVINTGNTDFHAGIGIASHVISHAFDMGNTMFDFAMDALVHYRYGCCWGVVSSLEAREFQIGNNPFGALWEGKLNGIDSIGMSSDGAVLWDLGKLPPGGERSLTLKLIFSGNINELKNLAAEIKPFGFRELSEQAAANCSEFLKKCRQITSGSEKVDRIYQRSLLLFRLMSGKNTGGLLASPEIDEGFTQCGRYAYCWGRDAAFITRALDEAGLHDDAGRFYDWVVGTQDQEGFWYQRYHMNGNIAPSWGIQIDETGSILHGMLNHFLYVKDIGFLERMWPAVIKATAFLERFIDEDTGLPLPSFDLWEERMGEHTYSTAAVIAGFRAGAQIGGLLGIAEETTGRWTALADKMQKALEKELVDQENNVFIRSIRTKLNPWGPEPTGKTTVIRVNKKGFFREVSLTDDKTDISLLGPAVPFDIYEPGHPVVKNTADRIERELTCDKAGGLYRYADDNYAGGNPWIVSTLWLALFRLKTGQIDSARKYFQWSVRCATQLDFLPEQADKQDGKPCWVIPLTWSHAMFVLVLKELMENGGIGEIEI